MAALNKIVFFICTVVCSSTLAQDMETLDLKNPVKISGSFGASATGYSAAGIANRRDPFYWMLSGTLNVQFLEFNVPLSVTLSQQEKRFSQPQPFNQFGLSPSYKAITLHAGYRSMNFSDYTLAGHVFLGGGIEVKPKNMPIQVSAMYGRLQKAVADSISDGLVYAVPAYERWGHGTKINIGKQKSKIDLIYFYAKDDISSIANTDSLAISPQENLVLGVNVTQQITEKINFSTEYAYSMFTRDVRLENSESTEFGFLTRLGGVFRPNASSQFNNAVKSKLSYTDDQYQVDIGYRRVDPEYRTLGATFVTNDFEDISVGASKTFFNGKMNVGANVGVQHNNLNDQQLSELKRALYGLTLSGNITEQLFVNVDYNNFTTSTKMMQLNTLDSLRYYQVTNNAVMSISHTDEKNDMSHSRSLYINYQGAEDSENSTAGFYNFSGTYGLTISPLMLTMSASLNYNLNEIDSTTTHAMGPAIMVSKSLFKKTVQCSLSGTYLKNQLEEGDYTTRSVRLNATYRFKKKHNLSWNIFFTERSGVPELEKPIAKMKELRSSIAYHYRF